jgi:surface polysaccharide O-acyltransferase-like enzyme
MLYPIVGYLLATTDFNKRQRIGIYVIAVVAALIVILPTLIMSPIQGQVEKLFWSNTSFGHLLVTAGVFVFFKQINWQKLTNSAKKQQLLSKLSSSSFGVYLIHVFAIYYVQHFPIIGGGGILFRTLGALVVYAICVAVVLLIKKIPVLNRLFP